WVLSDELFSKKTKFTLKPYGEWALQWSWPNGLPEGAKPPVNENKMIHMEAQDIPAFQVEDDMPPEAAMKYRVDFIYSEDGLEKEISNIEDVWKRGYADGNEITLLFVGLARAAGFDASPVRVATRDDHFFKPNIMRSRDLNTYVALVKVNGKDSYFDPGAAFTPFGLLPWSETGTAGLKLDKEGGTWVTTTMPEPSASQDRKSVV